MPKRSRCRPLRVERDDVLVFVTNRTIEERFWLLPLLTAGLEHRNRAARRMLEAYERRHDRRIERLVERINRERGPYQARLDVETTKTLLRDHVGAALARAQARYGVQILAVIVMGNHVHLVVRTPKKNLSGFMGYFKARVADSTNFLLGRRGPLWARRYDAEPILDDQAAVDRVLYTVANAPQSNLVERAELWPGLTAAYALGGATQMDFTYMDRTAWHRAGRPEDVAPYLRTATLTLSRLDAMEGLSGEQTREAIEELVRQREAKERGRRRDEGRCVMGLEKLSKSQFQERPRRPKRSLRPYFHARDPARRLAHLQSMNALHACYEDCADRFLSGQPDVAFPKGTYPPPLPMAA